MDNQSNYYSKNNPITGFESACFGQLDKQVLDKLLSIGTTSRYPKGTFIFCAGEAGQHVFFLHKGRIKISNLSPAGHEVILWFCFSCEMFGLSEITRGNDRAVSAQACEDSEVTSIPRELFNTFLIHHPKVAFLIMQILSCRMRVLGDMLVNLVSDNVNTRLVTDSSSWRPIRHQGRKGNPSRHSFNSPGNRRHDRYHTANSHYFARPI